MDKYRETFTTWNNIAARYEDKFMDLDLYDKTYDIICNSLDKEQTKILEVGCGPGNITKYILSKRPDFDVFGIDIAPNMIAPARKNNPTAAFEVMDIRQIHSLKSTYDGIICGFCLPYLSAADVAKLIEDCYKLLNENGLIYLSFVEGDPAKSGFQTGSTGERSYFYYHRLSDLRAQLESCKFGNINVIEVDYKKSDSEMERHTILTARKMAAL